MTAGADPDQPKRMATGRLAFVGFAALVLPPVAAAFVQSVVLRRDDCYADPLTTITVTGDLIVLVGVFYIAPAVAAAAAFAPGSRRLPPSARVAMTLAVLAVAVAAIGVAYADKRGGANALPCDRPDLGPEAGAGELLDRR